MVTERILVLVLAWTEVTRKVGGVSPVLVLDMSGYSRFVNPLVAILTLSPRSVWNRCDKDQCRAKYWIFYKVLQNVSGILFLMKLLVLIQSMLLSKVMFERIFILEGGVAHVTRGSFLGSMLCFHVSIYASRVYPIVALRTCRHFRLRRSHQSWKKNEGFK